LADFLKSNQNGPFIRSMLGRMYEKVGDKAKVIEYCREASSEISHNPLAACAAPFARKRLARLRG
jgi:hypothetical protein